MRKKWDLENFMKLAKKERKFEKIKRYAESLAWRKWAVDYHLDNYRREMRKFEKISTVVTKKDIMKFIFQMRKSAEEIICIIQIQASIMDMLAQIINLIILKPSLKEEKVSFNEILKEKNKNRWQDKEIFERCKKLRESRELKYILAFSNVVKHRKLIKDYYRHGVRKAGLKFESFKYRGKEYSSKFFKNIVENYIPFINDSVTEIGQLINKFLNNKLCYPCKRNIK